MVISLDSTTSETACVEVHIMEDSVLESDEVFQLHLSSNDSAVLLPDPTVNVEIIDNDGNYNTVEPPNVETLRT